AAAWNSVLYLYQTATAASPRLCGGGFKQRRLSCLLLWLTAVQADLDPDQWPDLLDDVHGVSRRCDGQLHTVGDCRLAAGPAADIDTTW
ncbi:hypothetical protein HaLaN_02740, partial [Haematococcus lacustris]